MSDRQPSAVSLDGLLSALRARRRRLLMLDLAARGLFYGGVCAVLIALAGAVTGAEWIRPIPWPAVMALPVLALLGAAMGLLCRLDPLPLARALDRAAGSEDRFASVLQLAAHHRQERVRLATEDALARVRTARLQTALPWRAPRELRWVPVPVLVLVAVCWLAPGRNVQATEPAEPEISAEEWAHIHEDFRKQLDDLDWLKTDEEKAIRQELERLRDELARQPEKKQMLARIAQLQGEIERRRKGLSTREVSMRRAANAIQGEKPLDKLAEQLRKGDYKNAARELKALGDKLAARKLNMTAAEFEAAARDFEKLSRELAAHEQLSGACRDCSNAASSMSNEQLSEALKKLSQTLDKNCEDLRKCDSCRSANSLLEELRRRLADKRACSSCNRPGCSSCNSLVRRNDKKGGLQAGWGSALKWDGGELSKDKDRRLPTLADPREGSGASQVFSTISPEENAQSAQEYRELYAEMIRKAEADLALEEVPLAYRDYLRRYFNAIRPAEEPSGARPGPE